MHFLESYYQNTIKYDLINKFPYNNLEELPKLEKIILNFGCKNFEMQNLAKNLLALELISTQKGTLTISKDANIFLKIRKGYPTGCKVILRKKTMYKFLIALILKIFPKIKNFTGLTMKNRTIKNAFSYELKTPLVFSKLEKQYYLFNNISNLKITLITTSKNQNELKFLLKSFQLPFRA